MAKSYKKINGVDINSNVDLSSKQDVLTESNFGNFANGLNEKVNPINADLLNIVDTADANKQKKLTFTNLKAFLKTYLDTLYITKKPIITNASVSGTFNLDASLADTYDIILTGNTTLALINVSTTYAQPMTVYITGNFTLAYPSGSTLIGDTYLGTGKNQLVIEKIASVIYITVNNYV